MLTKLVFTVLTMAIIQGNATREKEKDMTLASEFDRCTHIRIKSFHIDNKVCVVIKYLSTNLGINMSITWSGKTVFSKEISVRNPPPFCFGVPMIKYIRACLKLTDVSWKPHHHGACLSLTCYKTFKLGCIYAAQRETGTAMKDWYHVRKADKIKWRTEYEYPDWIVRGGRQKKITSGSVDVEPQPSIKCVCSKPRKCMCCSTILHNQTKVCGKIVCSKKGKGIWIDLFINNNKDFRVYTPVSRRFTMVCGIPRINNVTSTTCLELRKVEQGILTLQGCLLAHITVKTVHLHQDLGCFTLKHKAMDDHSLSDAILTFKPWRRLNSRKGLL